MFKIEKSLNKKKQEMGGGKDKGPSLLFNTILENDRIQLK